MYSDYLFRLLVILSFLSVLSYVNGQSPISNINVQGNSVSTRIETPENYDRIAFSEDTYEYYLQNYPLHTADKKVMKYDGYEKLYECYVGVVVSDLNIAIDMIHGEHIIQFLRANFLFQNKRYDKINYCYDDGRRITFDQWGAGGRFVLKNSEYIIDTIASKDYSYESFKLYMKELYSKSTTQSLTMDTKYLQVSDINIGDVFVQPKEYNGPGHAVLVMDAAINSETGEKLVLLAQGFTPSQNIHILKNPYDESISPWYRVDDESPYFATAQWTFRKKHIRRFLIDANDSGSDLSNQMNTEE